MTRLRSTNPISLCVAPTAFSVLVASMTTTEVVFILLGIAFLVGAPVSAAYGYFAAEGAQRAMHARFSENHGQQQNPLSRKTSAVPSEQEAVESGGPKSAAAQEEADFESQLDAILSAPTDVGLLQLSGYGPDLPGPRESPRRTGL